MKDRLKNIIYIFLIIVFSLSLVQKQFQNDTYFDIAVGEKILNQGIYVEEDFSFVEGLEYENVRWLFDITVAKLYNLFDFHGIYIFVIFITILNGISLFYILVKQKNSKLLSFLLVLFTMYLAKFVFIARAHSISFLIFIWEYYFIEKLLDTKQKRYIVILMILSILLANIHASVYPLFFVMFLPYLAEEICSKFKKIPQNENKIICEDKNGIYILIITMFITFWGGCITPLTWSPYVNMFKTVGAVSSDVIMEMKPLVLANNFEIIWYSIIFIAIIGFTKIKVNLKDCLFLLGFLLMTLSNIRSMYFFILIGVFSIAKISTKLIKEYKINIIIDIKLKKIISVTCIVFFLYICITDFCNECISGEYVSKQHFPIDAVDFIFANYSEEEIENMHIYNGFDYGSYMEFKGIPVFLDSRAEIYISQFNDTTIMEDFIKINEGLAHYNTVFDKYEIDYALVYNDDIINIYMYEDDNWELKYQDEVFAFYERRK